jgi:uncharacterized protein
LARRVDILWNFEVKWSDNVGRILLLLAMAVVAWLLIKRFLGGADKRGPDNADRPETAEPILACSECGLHVPVSEGLTKNGVFYCCEAHSRRPDDRRGD